MSKEQDTLPNSAKVSDPKPLSNVQLNQYMNGQYTHAQVCNEIEAGRVHSGNATPRTYKSFFEINKLPQESWNR